MASFRVKFIGALSINFMPKMVSKTEWLKVILTFLTTVSKNTPFRLKIEEKSLTTLSKRVCGCSNPKLSN